MQGSLVYWQLKTGVSVVGTFGNGIYIAWLGQRFLLKGVQPQTLSRLLEALSKPQELGELIELMAGKAEPETVRKLVSTLADYGLLVVNEPSPQPTPIEDCGFKGWFNRLAVSPAHWNAGVQRWRNLRVHCVSDFVFLKSFLSANKTDFIPLSDWGVEHFAKDNGEEALYLLVLPAHDESSLQSWSAAAQQAGARCLPVLLDKDGFVMGPLCNGPGLPCLECATKRLQAHRARQDAGMILDAERMHGLKHAWPATYWQMFEAMLTQEIFRWRSGVSLAPLASGCVAVDLLNIRTQYSDIYPIPGCVCSRWGLVEARPPHVQD